jgi:hypothetical protein
MISGIGKGYRNSGYEQINENIDDPYLFSSSAPSSVMRMGAERYLKVDPIGF